MRNPLKQFFCEHDYKLFREDYYNLRVIWYKCSKCKHLRAFVSVGKE